MAGRRTQDADETVRLLKQPRWSEGMGDDDLMPGREEESDPDFEPLELFLNNGEADLDTATDVASFV